MWACVRVLCDVQLLYHSGFNLHIWTINCQANEAIFKQLFSNKIQLNFRIRPRSGETCLCGMVNKDCRAVRCYERWHSAITVPCCWKIILNTPKKKKTKPHFDRMHPQTANVQTERAKCKLSDDTILYIISCSNYNSFRRLVAKANA